jgi:glycosyltransferase involved in cell wall biosynthesis
MARDVHPVDAKTQFNTKRPMRIAYVLSHINQSTQWVWFSEELIKRKVPHVFVIINPTYPALANELSALGAEVYYFRQRGKWSLIKTVLKTAWLFKKKKINLVHSELPVGNVVGQIAARLCRITARVVTCENTTWAEDFQSKRQLAIDRFAYSSAKKIIALTNPAADYLHEKFRLPRTKLAVIHHSLKQSDYESISSQRVERLRQQLGIREGEFILGMVARFEFWKGHRFVIEAMRKLVTEFPAVRLHICGGRGESYMDVMDAVQHYGLRDYVVHHEHIEDNKALYSLFDIQLHVPVSPLCETFGIAIIEGMITATPQVLTNSGISVLTAKDGENCLLVEYTSAEAIYNAVKRLIEDDGLRKRLGENAQKDALRLFNYTEKVNQHMVIYTSLFSQKK